MVIKTIARRLALMLALALVLTGAAAPAEEALLPVGPDHALVEPLAVGEDPAEVVSDPAEALVPELEDAPLPGPEDEALPFEMEVSPAEDVGGGSAAAQDAPSPQQQIEPISFGLEQTELTLGVGEVYDLTLENGISPESVEAQFSSSNSQVVMVKYATGEITALRTGSATVTMRTLNGEYSCAVTVLKAPSKVTLSDSKLVLGLGEEASLSVTLPAGTASSIRFTSSDPTVATVDRDGHIMALGRGSAKITARAVNGKKAACKVSVKAAPTSVTLDEDVFSLWEGDVCALSPRLSKGSAGGYTISVSDGGVLAVEDGKLVALAQGSGVVTVTTYNGLTAEASVEVSRRPVYRALLIGEGTFPDPSVGNLPGKKDVALMKKMLRSVKGAANDKWAITTRTDRTSAQIQTDIVTAFEGAQEGDVSLFYISTHGDEELTIDGRYPEYAGCLQTYPDYSYSNWYDQNTLTLPRLAQWLSEVPGQVIVLIDSCGSGAAIYGAKALNGYTPAQFDAAVIEAFEDRDMAVMAPGLEHGAFVVSNKFYVLTSAAYLETGWASTNKYSFFTKWLTDGIATKGGMPADGNRNRTVTLDELYKYISKRADRKTFSISGLHYKQHVQVYPAGSDFKLFYRK